MLRVTPRYTFFFRPECPFSQWYPAPFTVEGRSFRCAEQFMMFEKARLFGDAEMGEQILAAKTPKEHKALGRKVRGFDDARWKSEREGIVLAGSRAKFTQNPELRALLLDTRGTELVEASPFDRIWGVGLSADNPRIDDPANWRGQNLLGKILTRLREELLAEEAR
jgi:ribA/ribD-fused uncharacterized protein